MPGSSPQWRGGSLRFLLKRRGLAYVGASYYGDGGKISPAMPAYDVDLILVKRNPCRELL